MSVACVVHYLWTTRARRGLGTKKIAWSLFTLVPLVGPLIYGAFHLFPSEQEADLQAVETDTDDV